MIGWEGGMDGHWRDVVGVGEKSGVYVLLDAKSGEFIWNTLIGTGGDQGHGVGHGVRRRTNLRVDH